MKIRKGFVSNSSSSSFLVAFPKFPKTKEDVKQMVFGKDKWFCGPYSTNKHSVDDIADVIWHDVKKQIPNNKNYIFSRMPNILIHKFDNYWRKDNWRKDDWNEDNKEEVRKFMAKHNDAYFYVFTYADEDGKLGCDMEHGDLFKRLPHLISNNH